MSSRIRAARKRAGFSQAALGRLVQTSQQSVAKWENPNVDVHPQSAKLPLLARVLGVSVDELVGEVQEGFIVSDDGPQDIATRAAEVADLLAGLTIEEARGVLAQAADQLGPASPPNRDGDQ